MLIYAIYTNFMHYYSNLHNFKLIYPKVFINLYCLHKFMHYYSLLHNLKLIYPQVFINLCCLHKFLHYYSNFHSFKLIYAVYANLCCFQLSDDVSNRRCLIASVPGGSSRTGCSSRTSSGRHWGSRSTRPAGTCRVFASVSPCTATTLTMVSDTKRKCSSLDTRANKFVALGASRSAQL